MQSSSAALGRVPSRRLRQVLRLKTSQLSTWDAILPEELTRLPGELARVDQWLDD